MTATRARSSESPGRPSRREFLVAAGLTGLAAAVPACRSSPQPATPVPGSLPKRGGALRIGVTGGGAKDVLDGQHIVTKPDQARIVAGWETLLVYDANYQLANDGLAEEVVQDRPDTWTIRLRSGVEFHDGKTLGADDVIYSLRRILDPKLGLGGAANLASVDPQRLAKVDDRTVRATLRYADATFADSLAVYVNTIVPEGHTREGPKVGTGPFKLESFAPGQQSVHVRNPNYWRTDQPWLDQVTVINFRDTTAQVNALIAGQVDAITDIPYAQIGIALSRGLAILESPGASWLPLCMAIDEPPFDDVRVRQAMRLIVDRPQVVQQVLSGHGRVANDLYAPFDPCFDTSLPQRTQDLAQARALLEQAGHAGLSVDLHTTDGAAGMVDIAKVFAEQAKGAGVHVNVRIDSNYYGDQYLKLPFSVDFFGTRNFLPQVAVGGLPKSPFNETHWPPPGSDYEHLYGQALAEPDAAKRCEIIHRMQRLEYDDGGYIIACFNNLVDAYSPKLQGLAASRSTLNLDSFGHGYRTIWFG